MTEASATSNAENVKPRDPVPREDSTEERSRMGGVLPSRKEDQMKEELLRTRCWSMQTGRKCASA